MGGGEKGSGFERAREVAARGEGDGWRLLFWTVFGRSWNPMALLTSERRIIAPNHAAVELLGYSRGQLVGRRIDTIVVPDEWRFLDREWREFERRGDYEGERALLNAEGQRIEVQFAMRWTHIRRRRVALVVVIESRLEPVRLRTARSLEASVLSPREIEIIGHVAMGQRAHEIADELGIAESTVRTHLRNALKKTGARSQAQLVAIVCSGQGSNALLASSVPTRFGR
jgi:PAS domain S-box-containing protein